MKRSNGGIDLSLDYHAHVLPGCDHGSDRLETSLRQLHMAAAAGIRTICATPHFYPHKESAEAFLRRREECAQLLRAHLPEQAPQICLGAEVLICDGMERLEGLHRLCREGTNELLLEMPFMRGRSLSGTRCISCWICRIYKLSSHTPSAIRLRTSSSWRATVCRCSSMPRA